MARKRHLKSNRPNPDPFEARKAAVLKALRSHHQSNFADLLRAIDVLMSESDRGAIILVGGLLEDVLAQYTIGRMPNGAAMRNELLSRAGSLSSFQDKLSVGRALGVIDQATFDSLDIIRQIRNSCAHSLKEIILHEPPISDAIDLLLTEEAAVNFKREPTSDRARINLALIMVFHVERIRGKSCAEAQAVVDDLIAKMFAPAEAHRE